MHVGPGAAGRATTKLPTHPGVLRVLASRPPACGPSASSTSVELTGMEPPVLGSALDRSCENCAGTVRELPPTPSVSVGRSKSKLLHLLRHRRTGADGLDARDGLIPKVGGSNHPRYHPSAFKIDNLRALAPGRVAYGPTVVPCSRSSRHLARCPHRAKGRRYRACQCPIMAEGRLQGTMMRRSLDIASWEGAQATVREWEALGDRKSVV